MSSTKYKRRMQVPAKIGDKVTPTGSGARREYPTGTVGTVVEVLDGCCGPILAVRFPSYPGVTVDLFWKKVRRMER